MPDLWPNWEMWVWICIQFWIFVVLLVFPLVGAMLKNRRG